MDIQTILTEAAQLPAPSGHESPAAAYFADLFRPYTDEVTIDAMFNVIAHKKGSGPRVMLSAHQDEIALVVSHVEADGAIRLGSIGGVDPRILPASRVWVHGRERLPGVIGAPLHYANGKNYKRDDLFVDLGLPVEKIKSLVRTGDLVTFRTGAAVLRNRQFACKTMDDRACVALLLAAAEQLQKMISDADVYFVASTREEVGSMGALTAAFSIRPDFAIALDVNHATTPGCPPGTVDLDSLSATVGPMIQPKLLKRLQDCAGKHHVKLQTDVAEGRTWTDADQIALSGEGIPVILLSLPLKYMHTTVETIDLSVLEEGGRLIAHFLAELDSSWEDDLWI